MEAVPTMERVILWLERALSCARADDPRGAFEAARKAYDALMDNWGREKISAANKKYAVANKGRIAARRRQRLLEKKGQR